MKRFELLKELPGFPAGTVLCAKGNKGSAVQKLYTESGDILSGYELHDSLIYVGAGVGAGPISNWLRELPDDEHRRWRAEHGKYYYCVETYGVVDPKCEGGWSIDDDRYNIGNYFQTAGEAKALIDYWKALAVVRDDSKGFVPDWSDGEQAKAYVSYSHRLEDFFVGETWQDKDNGVFGLPYFASYKDAKASIEKHKAEWLTIFGVKGENDDCEE